MLNFKFFLTEAADESKLTHLEHAEDHVINAGEKGFAHAYHNLQDVHDKIKGKHNATKITTKYDGSPSVVFGHHPQTGKFFVATKSAFNKSPKLNYTEKDVEENHGHAPGLVTKLKHALKHLPKVAPKHGVYQGDLMHSGVKSKENPEGDVESKQGKFHFKPNTITYSTKHTSTEGKKIAHSKLGIAVHTAYKGDNLENMKAHYAPDLSHFKHHPDVHNIDTQDDAHKTSMTDEQHAKVEHHMHEATKHFNEAPKDFGHKIDPHREHLKVYINKTVRENSKPSIDGYKQHLTDKFTKEATKLKTDRGIQGKMNELHKHTSHVDAHADHFKSTLNMHHHLQKAKDTLVHALSAKPKFDHHIGGIKTKPEGYVVVRNNRPTKLVDRAEFSRANFLRDKA
jgi:hypothetical protein